MPVSSVVLNRRVYVGGYDLTGTSSSQELSIGFEQVDATVMSDTTRSSLPGLMTASLTHQGFVTEGTSGSESIYHNKLGDSVVVTMGCETASDGEAAYFLKGNGYSLTLPDNIGELPQLTFEIAPDQSEGVARGTVLHDAVTARTSSGTGTVRELGAVSSSQKLYAAIHVIAASGSTPTLDVVIRSDDNSGMTSPVTRMSCTQVTSSVGAEYLSPVSGPITDSFWDISATLSGGSASYNFIVTVGIQ